MKSERPLVPEYLEKTRQGWPIYLLTYDFQGRLNVISNNQRGEYVFGRFYDPTCGVWNGGDYYRTYDEALAASYGRHVTKEEVERDGLFTRLGGMSDAEASEDICPRCGKPMFGHPALSRRDNRTEICSDCGVAEAMEDFSGVRTYRLNHANSEGFFTQEVTGPLDMVCALAREKAVENDCWYWVEDYAPGMAYGEGENLYNAFPPRMGKKNGKPGSR